MNELSIARNNHQIDPTLAIWGWEIPVYLFLGGLVAGMMIITGYFMLTGRKSKLLNTLPLLGIVLLSLGMGALFLDLEHKLYVWRLYLTFKPKSPMSWGAWILLLVYPVLAVQTLVYLPNWLGMLSSRLNKLSEDISKNEKLKKAAASLSVLLGFSLGVYTGVLLSLFSARPLWNSAVLWLLFVTSGLSSALALAHLLSKDKEESALLQKGDIAALGFELFVLFMFLISLSSSGLIHAQAASLLLNGVYAPFFWVFIVIVGVLLPLFLQVMELRHKIPHTVAAPLFVLAGGLFLRFLIVNAGQYSSWSSALHH